MGKFKLSILLFVCTILILCPVMVNGVKPPRPGKKQGVTSVHKPNVGTGIKENKKSKSKAAEYKYKGMLDGSAVFYIPYNSWNSSTIPASSFLYVEMMASIMNSYPKSKIDIRGYGPRDGSLDFSIALASARADAVKKMLVKKYGISADRITAEGQGIGHMFSEESWNWVAICTIENIGDTDDLKDSEIVYFVPFEKGASTISSDYMIVVYSICSYLANRPNSKLLLEGFESVAEAEDPYITPNLPYERAYEIKEFIENNCGIDQNRIITRSGGVSDDFPMQAGNQGVRCVVNYQ